MYLNPIFRVEDCIRNGQAEEIIASIDQGKWFSLKFLREQCTLPNTGWNTFPTHCIPTSFCYGTIKDYIEKCLNVDCDSDTDDDCYNNQYVPTSVVNSKSMRRGRIIFTSGHVQDIEDNMKNGLFYLRANVIASYKDTIYKVAIVLNNDSTVKNATCQCKASESESCSHIIGLLFTLEDYTVLFGFQPATCTSKLKTWNMGRKRGRNPKCVLDASYPHHSKPEMDRKRFKKFDPVPYNSKHTEIPEGDFLRNLQSCNQTSMFEIILKIKYEDYQLEPERKNILNLKIKLMMSDLISVNSGPILKVTDQNTTDWLIERRVRITASKAKSYFTAKSVTNLINQQLWKQSCDLSNVPAIKYGRENENKAFDRYKQLTGYDVRKCGFFTNKSLVQVS